MFFLLKIYNEVQKNIKANDFFYLGMPFWVLKYSDLPEIKKMHGNGQTFTYPETFFWLMLLNAFLNST